jgi:prepilin-type N-terminal cleavage/methylation domain-containing protein
VDRASDNLIGRRARPVGRRPSGREAGFTLVEALVVLAVVAIVLSTTGPSVVNAMGSYSRSAAARDVLSEIRRTQSLAVTRGGIFVFQWGGDAAANRPVSQYRLVRDTTKACGLPSVTAAVDGTNVIKTWRDLGVDYKGMTIQSIRDASSNNVYKVMFNSMGQSVNTCATTTFPVTVTLADSAGRTRSVVIQSAGWSKAQ